MIELGRRSLVAGLGALIAAPAIVKVSSLMKLAPTEVIRLRPYGSSNNLLTVDMITRDAVKRFRNNNAFLLEEQRQYNADYAFMEGAQWDKEFVANGVKIGNVLRIRLPNEQYVPRPEWLSIASDQVAPALVGAALAVAAAPLIEQKLAEPVSRRSLFRRRA